MEEAIQRVKDVTVLAGSGVSAESGIPTFLGEDGLWKKYHPEDVDTPDAFKHNPKYVWEWYNVLRELMLNKEPNPGHYALAKLEKIKSNFTLITQNIDGLHRIAGNRRIIELHGNIWWLKCTECTYIGENYEVPQVEIPPRCKRCGGLLRPNTVGFGDNIPLSLIDSCLLCIEFSDIMLIVGTSEVVEPAASLGLVAKHTGKTVIEVNLEETEKSKHYDLLLLGKSGEILPKIIPD